MPRFQTCSKCRALLEPGTKKCPYCAANQRHMAAPSAEQDAESTTRFGLWLLLFLAGVYVLTLVFDPAPDMRAERFSPSGLSLTVWGANDQEFVGQCGQYWRFLSATLLHADPLHLLLNGAVIFLLLPLAAQTLGADRSTCVYIGGALVGSVASFLYTPAGAVGASGAVCALISAIGIYGWKRGGIAGQMLARRMLIWGVVVAVFGLMSDGIDNAGHFGGFAGGALLGWLGSGLRARGSLVDRVWRWGAIAGLLLMAVAVGVGMIPNAARGFERAAVIDHHEDLRVAIQKIQRVASSIPGGTLPEKVPDGPGGSDAVRDAVARALDAVKEGRGDAQVQVDAAWQALSDWEARIRCPYNIRGRKRR